MVHRRNIFSRISHDSFSVREPGKVTHVTSDDLSKRAPSDFFVQSKIRVLCDGIKIKSDLTELRLGDDSNEDKVALGVAGA